MEKSRHKKTKFFKSCCGATFAAAVGCLLSYHHSWILVHEEDSNVPYFSVIFMETIIKILKITLMIWFFYLIFGIIVPKLRSVFKS